MITRKTVLILGAGASEPYGFPLAKEMMRLLTHHETTFQQRDPLSPDPNDSFEAILHPSFADKSKMDVFHNDLTGSRLDSIDSFLAARPEYKDLGKAAIAATLIPYESQDRLKSPKSPDKDWCELLRNRMGGPFEDFAESARHLSIVTFNYDRSFEYYFFDASKSTYGQPRALEVIKSMRIVHVYGQLGMPEFLSPDGRPYSPKLDRKAIERCVAEIKVVPEDRDGSPEFKLASDLIESAESICFLGFGFNETNMKRLATKKKVPFEYVSGTMFGMKAVERSIAYRLLKDYITTEPTGARFGNEQEDARLLLRTHFILIEPGFLNM